MKSNDSQLTACLAGRSAMGMSKLERWLLYFFAAATVLLAIYRIESHRSIRLNFRPANGNTELPRSSGGDGGSNNKAFVLR